MLEDEVEKEEIGDQAVWSASTAKSGAPVQMLRDGSEKTFWQSDGSLPHYVCAHFLRRVALVELQIRFDYKADESYTPCRLSIRAGTTMYDLREVKVVEVPQVSHWFSISLLDDARLPLRANFVQILVLANHQSGRDSRLRLVRIYAARKPSEFTTLEFQQYAGLR